MPTSLFNKIREKIYGDNEKCCRICSDEKCDSGDKWIKPCSCKGSILWVHHSCLKKWMEYSSSSKCTTCGTYYRTNKTISDTSKLTKFLFNYKIINLLSIYILAIIYWGFYIISNFWNQKYKNYFFNWFYVIRGICVLSIVFYIGFYLLVKKINEKYVENVESPNIILEDDTLLASSFMYIPLNILGILKNIFKKEEKIEDIEILDFLSW